MPTSFTEGVLIPILKKPSSNLALPNSHRPIILSTMFSKLMEKHILYMSGDHEFNDVQFGFIEGRGTDMAVSLTHYIIYHCISRGSTVYTCSLDSEGAFDATPHV